MILRTIQSFITLVLISFMAFYFVHKMPGSPYYALGASSEEQRWIELERHIHLLDRPIWYQYLHWLWPILHGNFGGTMPGDLPVRQELWPALHGTLLLICVPWLAALLIAIP